MKKPFHFIFLWLTYILSLPVYGQESSLEIRNDFKSFYDEYKLEGAFILFDESLNQYILYNPELAEQGFTPASTFKICNSLIGLETGVIKDENFVIHWDSVTRQNPNWNRDHDLKSAFKNSTVWYYQELARRVGGQQMKYWLDKANYGNADTSGGIDKFWLSGGLRISARQQIDFLRKLRSNQLPFSERSMELVKKIMICSDTQNAVLRAKTGWGTQDNQDIGWYVGYLETQNKVYYFVNLIKTADYNNHEFAQARMDITLLIFKNLNISAE